MSFDTANMNRVAQAITGEVARPDYGTPKEIVAGALWAAYGLVRHNFAGDAAARKDYFVALATAIAEDIEGVTGATH